MLKGKINSFETYTIMLPYAGFWPTVHELHYEPTQEEFGKTPRVYFFNSGFGRCIEPQALPKDAPRTELQVNSAPRTLPLKSMIDLEDRLFRAFGPEFYDKHPDASTDMLYLVIEKNGERLAEYLVVMSPKSSGGVGPHNIVFGADAPLPMEPKRVECDDANAAIASVCGRPVHEIHLERRPYELRGFTAEGKMTFSAKCWQSKRDQPVGAPLYLADVRHMLTDVDRVFEKQTLTFDAGPDRPLIGHFLRVHGDSIEFTIAAAEKQE